MNTRSSLHPPCINYRLGYLLFFATIALTTSIVGSHTAYRSLPNRSPNNHATTTPTQYHTVLHAWSEQEDTLLPEEIMNLITDYAIEAPQTTDPNSPMISKCCLFTLCFSWIGVIIGGFAYLAMHNYPMYDNTVPN